MIKVLKSGFYSTIQDQGRFGYRTYGVPVSGAMDSYSSLFANALLGNTQNAAVLEMTMIGAQLKFQTSTAIAITGANMRPTLNDLPIPMFKSINVKTGDILSFRNAIKGFRTYLGVEGGFLTEEVLGSRSMANEITKDVNIQSGSILNVHNLSINYKRKNATLRFDSSILDDQVLEAFEGPEFDKLSKEQKSLLVSRSFQVSKYNNRMAYQLQPFLKNNLEPILTGPVLPGTVQLTPSGQLIVLMRDAQTTGGYPRVLQLTKKAINILSQKTTGNTINFQLISL